MKPTSTATKRMALEKVRCKEYLENATQFKNILMACEPSLIPEIEKLWYQKYGFKESNFKEPECPNKLMTIISSLHNDDDDVSMKFEYIEYTQDNPDHISASSDSGTKYNDISDDISIKPEYIEYGHDDSDNINVHRRRKRL